MSLLGTIYILLVCCAIERIAAIKRYSLSDRLPGFLMNIAQVLISGLLVWPLAKLWTLLGLGPLLTIPLWQLLKPLGWLGYGIQFLLLVVVADFLAYWRHRAEHEWFWPIHVVHHSPTELHAVNDIGHPVQIFFSLIFITIPMSLFQIDGPETPAAVLFVVSLLSYYIHSPVDVHFGRFRKVLVDNRFHRIHHSLEERHFDKNFGICFSLWDHLFGTAYDPAPGEWPEVGVAGVPAPQTISDYLLLPVRLGRRGKRTPDCAPAPDGPAAACLTCGASSPRS